MLNTSHALSSQGGEIDRLTSIRTAARGCWAYLCRDGIVVGLAMTSIAVVALAWVGVPAFQGIGSYLFNVKAFFNAWLALILAKAVIGLRRDNPVSPIRYLISASFARGHGLQMLAGIPVMACVIAFMVVFGLVKSAIPLFSSYSWDPALIEIDRALHAGVDPWRWLQPVLGFPAVTSVLSTLYHAWFLLIYGGTVYFAAFQKDTALRRRYFVCYFLIWSVIGMAMAAGLASVGPCFVKPILGLDTFDVQMAYLRAADQQWPVATLQVQDVLVEWHRAGEHGFGRGISAMPSMHVALAFLFFLAMRHVARWAAWVFGAFFVIIQISSIHLGYHYAVDGYVSILVVGAIWKLTAPRAKAELLPRSADGSRAFAA